MSDIYVYITPNGEYVIESVGNGHGGMKYSFNTTKDINGASTFRTEELRGTIGCNRAAAFKKSIPQHKAILAKVTRIVELIL